MEPKVPLPHPPRKAAPMGVDCSVHVGSGCLARNRCGPRGSHPFLLGGTAGGNPFCTQNGFPPIPPLPQNSWMAPRAVALISSNKHATTCLTEGNRAKWLKGAIAKPPGHGAQSTCKGNDKNRLSTRAGIHKTVLAKNSGKGICVLDWLILNYGGNANEISV